VLQGDQADTSLIISDDEAAPSLLPQVPFPFIKKQGPTPAGGVRGVGPFARLPVLLVSTTVTTNELAFEGIIQSNPRTRTVSRT